MNTDLTVFLRVLSTKKVELQKKKDPSSTMCIVDIAYKQPRAFLYVKALWLARIDPLSACVKSEPISMHPDSRNAL
jgi:hypothetical protein